MDYTTPELVKEALDITGSSKDALIARLVPAASRAMDRLCTGSPQAVDYFKLETITDEEILGHIDNHGILICYPRKPKISSVAALSYRFQPWDTWTEVSQFGPEKQRWVKGNVASLRSCEVQVKISYTGGFATTVEDLPADFVETVTVLAGRFFKEDATGLTDAVGVAELGTIMYTKALPVRVKELLISFKRPVPY